MSFGGKTILERIDKKNSKLVSTLSFYHNRTLITALPGLIINGASIPRYFWSTIGCPNSGEFIGSAIIHDGLYKSQIMSREAADKLFLVMLRDNGVDIVRAYLMYGALRLFGWYSWNKKTPEEILKNMAFMQINKAEKQYEF